MHSGTVTREQAEKLYSRLRPMLSYLAELQERMETREFSRADRLYKEVVAARYTMQLLTEDVHRIYCGPSYPGNKASGE